jgi:hypothetical protein
MMVFQCSNIHKPANDCVLNDSFLSSNTNNICVTGDYVPPSENACGVQVNKTDTSDGLYKMFI